MRLNSLYEFEQKWLRGTALPDEQLIGSSDIQPLNDLAGSFEALRRMRAFPFDKTIVLKTVRRCRHHCCH
ncbi:MAG: hypothetical protein Q8L79_06225 [Methylobacter sp.]|uniref:hypothetical protein n=1 Tax=Methylobacter sp. TaxID=2051955 RepID=UPI00272F734F|nr:hypothetical protein [Methylobacter sp.]MDP1664709.1 hypothetical protein [Methylobacter sp.]MDP1969893.1 hypothetical protein [Methylobacter sp.]